MIKLEITGEDAYEFSALVATIATIFDIGTHPWDYPQVLEMVQKQHEHKAQMEALKKKTVAESTTIEPDHHNYSPQPAPMPTVDKPAAKPVTQLAQTAVPETGGAQMVGSDDPEDYISHEDLQRKCVDLGDAYGQAVFAELKKQAGFVSMKKLDPAGRQKFADLIDKYIADHPKG